MKVVFCCYIHEFHKEHCNNIIEELSNRDHEVIIAAKDNSYDADFAVQVDQIYPKLGNKGIFINHGLVNFPQNGFHYDNGYINDVQ